MSAMTSDVVSILSNSRGVVYSRDDDKRKRANHSLASCAAISSLPGSSNKCVASGTITIFFSPFS